MNKDFELPKQGFVFWPIGTGDSTTIVVKQNNLTMQIDLHHLEKSDKQDEPEWPIVDELVRLLPRKNGKPYLAVFALTHPDKDHIAGFSELLSKVHIGELWHTPRIFNEYKKDLCDDAKAFTKEAERRRDLTIKNKGVVNSGDRVRIIGHDDIFIDGPYKDFPTEWRTSPGSSVTSIDGVSLVGTFEAFIHAPFKDDSGGDRNNTSLAMQVALTIDGQTGRALFFGDRVYPTIKRIFDKTKERRRPQYLAWNIMLSSHHCSKSVMYWQDEGQEEETYRKDIMGDFEAAMLSGGYVVASSHSDFSNEVGKNPPHLKARRAYEKIVLAGHFICTHEYPDKKSPWPLVFKVDANGFNLADKRQSRKGPAGLAAAVEAARGGSQPPSVQVGFGGR